MKSIQSSIVFRAFVVIMLSTYGLVGCGDEDTESTGGEADMAGAGGMPADVGGGGGGDGGGGSGGAASSVEQSDITFGTSYDDTIDLDHATVVRIIEGNLTQHLDELDGALEMFENSEAVNNLLNLLPGDDDNEEGDDGQEDTEDDDGLSIDLGELRDSLLELLLEDLLVDAGATVSEDGQTVTYRVVPETFCAQEPEENESEESIRERAEDEADCVRRLEATPIRIHAISSGENKVQLTLQIGDEGVQTLRVQIQDDLIAGFIALSEIKAVVEIFVDAEDFEFPTTMDGTIAFEIRRVAESHFNVRFGVVDAIDIRSVEDNSMSFGFAVDKDLGALDINGPAKTVEGRAEIDTLDLNFGWQDVVDFFHDDEDEVEWVCTHNREQTEQCRQYRDECAPGCDASADGEEYEQCIRGCAESMPADMRDAVIAYRLCMRSISSDECSPEDWDCRNNRCQHTQPAASQYCDYREDCQEVRTPAPPAASVDGALKIYIPSIHGTLSYDGQSDIVRLSGIGLGADSTEISVNGDALIRADLNPDEGRALDVMISGQENNNVRFELAPKLDLRLMFAMHRVSDALEMPDFMQDETVTIRFEGSETPTLETIGTDEDNREMRVSAGRLILGSTSMSEDVVIEEGMCMGSDDGEELSEDERDARHDLFGDIVSESCGG